MTNLEFDPDLSPENEDYLKVCYELTQHTNKIQLFLKIQFTHLVRKMFQNDSEGNKRISFEELNAVKKFMDLIPKSINLAAKKYEKLRKS